MTALAIASALAALISSRPALARDATESPRCAREACGASALLADAGSNATFPLSSAFSLSDAPALRRTCRELALKGVARADARERYRERVEMQMERYRAEPVFGLLENKLLAKRALAALGVPHLAPIYGALAPDGGGWVGSHAALGGFSRGAMLAATAASPEWAGRAVVLKGATDGQSQSVRVFDRASMRKAFDAYLIGRACPATRADGVAVSRARRDACRGRAISHIARTSRGRGATNESALIGVLASEAEAFMNSSTPWGQRFEHRGVLVEPRYAAVGARGGGARAPRFVTSSVVELKCAVVVGVVHTILAFSMLSLRRERRDAAWEHRERRETGAWTLRRAATRRGAPFRCENEDADAAAASGGGCARVARLVNARVARIDAWSERVARFFGADWLRLDVLVGNEELGMVVNEITYPGHLQGAQGAWAYLVRKYCAQQSGARRDWATLPSRDVLARIAADIDIPLGFLESEPQYAEPLYTTDEGHDARAIFAEYFQPRSAKQRR